MQDEKTPTTPEAKAKFEKVMAEARKIVLSEWFQMSIDESAHNFVCAVQFIDGLSPEKVRELFTKFMSVSKEVCELAVQGNDKLSIPMENREELIKSSIDNMCIRYDEIMSERDENVETSAKKYLMMRAFEATFKN